MIYLLFLVFLISIFFSFILNSENEILKKEEKINQSISLDELKNKYKFESVEKNIRSIFLAFEKYEAIAETTNSILEKIVDMNQEVYPVIDGFLRNHKSDEKHQKTVDAFQRNWEAIKRRKNVREGMIKPAEKAGTGLPVAEDLPFFKKTDPRKRMLNERKDKDKEETISTKRVCLKKEENETFLPSIPLSQPSGAFDQPDEGLDFSSNVI